jgi:hypothetical protein
MALNGTEWRNAPWNTTFSPYTDMFAEIFGNGNVFYLIPLIVLAFGIYIKTENPVMAATFIMASGGIFAMGSFAAGLPELSMMFTIFVAMGITIIVASIIFQKRGY